MRSCAARANLLYRRSNRVVATASGTSATSTNNPSATLMWMSSAATTKTVTMLASRNTNANPTNRRNVLRSEDIRDSS